MVQSSDQMLGNLKSVSCPLLNSFTGIHLRRFWVGPLRTRAWMARDYSRKRSKLNSFRRLICSHFPHEKERRDTETVSLHTLSYMQGRFW